MSNFSHLIWEEQPGLFGCISLGCGEWVGSLGICVSWKTDRNGQNPFRLLVTHLKSFKTWFALFNVSQLHLNKPKWWFCVKWLKLDNKTMMAMFNFSRNSCKPQTESSQYITEETIAQSGRHYAWDEAIWSCWETVFKRICVQGHYRERFCARWALITILMNSSDNRSICVCLDETTHWYIYIKLCSSAGLNKRRKQKKIKVLRRLVI